VDLDNQFRFLGLQDVPQLMTEFRESTCRQIRDQGLREFNPRRRRHGYSHSASFAPIGHFTFMMRALMMRHAHNQTYTGKGTTLMSLPPKVPSLRSFDRMLSGSCSVAFSHCFLLRLNCRDNSWKDPSW
jgi:hypothetical protein